MCGRGQCGSIRIVVNADQVGADTAPGSRRFMNSGRGNLGR